MKKVFCLLSLLFFVFFLNSSVEVNAKGYNPGDVTLMGGFGYVDGGGVYTNTSFPVSVGNLPTEDVDLNKLKQGESTSRNILWLVEIGDASIQEAARKSGITKIHHADTQINKVFVPLLFLPIYIKETKTIVYGE